MDGVSTAISLFSSGYTAFKKVREMRKAIKDAPDQLKSLERSCAFTEQLLDNLKTTSSRLPSDIDLRHLHYLSHQAQRHLAEVENIADKVTKECLDEDGDVVGRKVRHMKWMFHKEDVERIETELKELQDTLSVLFALIQSHYSMLLLSKIDNVEARLASMAHTRLLNEDSCDRDALSIVPNGSEEYSAIDTAPSPPLLNHRRLNGPLRCPSNCECRCHYPSVVRLFPTWLTPYIGQVTISKRLLTPPWSAWSRCNVATCRGDIQRAMSVQWFLPSMFLHAFLQSTKDRRIHFSIGAPRTVAYGSPLLKAVYDGNVRGVRELFATGQASIWDYDVDGTPTFWHACRGWQETHSEKSLEVIRFFAEAGADIHLFEETHIVFSAHDNAVIWLFDSFICDTNEPKPLATLVRTNEAAIKIFRSIFNIDPMDALEDYFIRNRTQSMDLLGRLQVLFDDTERSIAARRSLLFTAIGYTPLRYAINWLPEKVLYLLESGEDAAVEATLSYAVNCGRTGLIKPLLDAGADVNMKDKGGYAALHRACQRCRYADFFELCRRVEEKGISIDWSSRTPDGFNALDLFDLGALGGWTIDWPQIAIDKFRGKLLAGVARDSLDKDEHLAIPGAFPDVP